MAGIERARKAARGREVAPVAAHADIGGTVVELRPHPTAEGGRHDHGVVASVDGHVVAQVYVHMDGIRLPEPDGTVVIEARLPGRRDA